MGLLDEVLKQAGGMSADRRTGNQPSGGLGSIAEMLTKNPQILAAALAMLNPRDRSVGGGGGLADVIGACRRGGLGDVVSSWVGTGSNRSVAPADLESALGGDLLGQFAQRAGIGRGDAGPVLASVLPEVVNQATPHGRLPEDNELDGVLGQLMGQLGR